MHYAMVGQFLVLVKKISKLNLKREEINLPKNF